MEKEKIYEILTKEIDLNYVKKDEEMKKYTSFKIGGKADILVNIRSEADLIYSLKVSNEYNIPLTIIGNGTNLLVKDNGIRGIVLKIDLDNIQIEKQENSAIIKLGAGVKNGVLAQMLLKEKIAGFEFACGIPGTIGGAVYMNAGAYGGEMKDIVKDVTYMEKDLSIHTITNEECKFDYRHSIFSEKDAIITNVTIELPYGKADEIKQKMNENMQSRKEKQPIQMPSAGSTFKRGTDFITAKLIDECGLKGYKVGGAQVSTMHAGFVVNTGNATAQDVINLTEHIKKEVLNKFSKQIELEIKIIGE